MGGGGEGLQSLLHYYSFEMKKEGNLGYDLEILIVGYWKNKHILFGPKLKSENSFLPLDLDLSEAVAREAFQQ